MNIKGIFYLFLFLHFNVFAVSSQNVQNPLCPKPLRMGWGEYAPFTMFDNSNREDAPVGIDIELFKLIAADVGCDVTFKFMFWNKQLEGLKEGTIDVVSSASKTKEREKYMFFLSPYIRDTNSLFMKKENIDKYKGKIRNFSDMKKIPNFKLGVTKGNYYGEEFAKASQDPEFRKILVFFDSDKDELINAEGDKVTGFLSDLVFVYETSDKLKISNKFDVFPIAIRNEGLYFGYSKKLPSELLQQLNASMNKFINIHANRDYFSTILSKYLPKKQIELLRIQEDIRL
jgi:polar amino acid transport system substrate-binding protein